LRGASVTNQSCAGRKGNIMYADNLAAVLYRHARWGVDRQPRRRRKGQADVGVMVHGVVAQGQRRCGQA